MDEERGYVTLGHDVGGFDYRTIAMHLTGSGDPCGHSTVRNVVLRTMEKFAYALMAQYGLHGDPAVIARSQGFQRLMGLLIQEVYTMRRASNKGNVLSR